ncbi:MAG TPA: disulfide oxidoreductase [Clostridiales bacterium]|nr:DUF1858 domain-containing protein [Clostridia bacterium]HCS73984.1 disulfide oxidoreductase [Clostridiales bacterium]
MAAINKEMTIAEALQIDRGTAPIFMKYGMHCLGCPSATGETIEEAAAVHGISQEELVKALNDYLSSK